MRILLSNDDGLFGRGLEPLVSELKKISEVCVIVPDTEKSASSHSITLHSPIRLIEKRKNVYTVTGTPSDCVRFGVIGIIKNKVDLVVSGINDGPNLGDDCIYSGTVAAAREGAMLGIPSLSVSLVPGSLRNFGLAAKYTAGIIKVMKKMNIPKYSFLNINVHDAPAVKGVEITRMGKRIYDEDIEERTDPRGFKYYWIAGERLSGHLDKGTDINAVKNLFVSVTPLKVDQTDCDFLKKLKKYKAVKAVKY